MTWSVQYMPAGAAVKGGDARGARASPEGRVIPSERSATIVIPSERSESRNLHSAAVQIPRLRSG